jgi:hypothetical protein
MTRERIRVPRLRPLVSIPHARRLTALLAMLAVAADTYAGGDFPIEYSAPSAAEQSLLNQATVSSRGGSRESLANAGGLVGDGRTDNTLRVRELLSGPGRTVIIPAGDYVTGSFSIASDVTLILERGVILRDSGRLGLNERLMNVLGKNVHVIGYGARLLSDRRAYTSGEQRHGVFIFGAESVTVEGLESDGHGGDGFYIGGPTGHPASGIRIINCLATNNRRQGLSITNASGVLVQSSSLIDTAGTAPQAGVDLEPNSPSDHMDGIRLIDVRTANNVGGGILVVLQKLDATSSPVDILILGHQSNSERNPIRSVGGGDAPGSVRYVSSAPRPN